VAIGNIYCLGRNYAAHAREMGHAPSREPLVFMKPASAVVAHGGVVLLPGDRGACHHEVELALVLGAPAYRLEPRTAVDCIAGYAVAIDLTLRELQARLKEARRPWEIAKAFEGSCPLSEVVPASQVGAPDELVVTLERNGELVQRGGVGDMILRPAEVVSYLSGYFHLRSGDVILTGTPHGVGPVVAGDVLRAELRGHAELEVGFELDQRGWR
jgi:acylpyruvate hydrolase